jgi:hypothetical protein
MGRKSTGAYTTGECKRIELSYLLKEGYLVKGRRTMATLSWTNTSSEITILTCYKEDEKYIELIYTTTYRNDGSTKKFRYKVYIQAVPSNLGKGEVLYFICPESGNKCRILYKAYLCDIWKSRTAYSHRIYYSLQQCSKLDRYNTKYWILDKKLYPPKRKRVNATYNGVKSRTAIRNEKMWDEYDRMERLRWSPLGIPKRLLPFAREMGH